MGEANQRQVEILAALKKVADVARAALPETCGIILISVDENGDLQNLSNVEPGDEVGALLTIAKAVATFPPDHTHKAGRGNG